MNNIEGSRTTYEDILKIDEQNTIVHYKLGMLDYDKKDYTASIAHFEKLVNNKWWKQHGISLILTPEPIIENIEVRSLKKRSFRFS